jgi:hypothetical protein
MEQGSQWARLGVMFGPMMVGLNVECWSDGWMEHQLRGPVSGFSGFNWASEMGLVPMEQD